MKKLCMLSVLLLPALAPAQQGFWEPRFHFGNDPFGADAIIAVHLIHTFDGTRGKVVAINQEFLPSQACSGGVSYASDRARLWSFPLAGAPGPGSFEAIPLCRTYIFCEGHAALADGRILNVGGHQEPGLILGTPEANLFDPVAPAGSQWNTGATPPDMFQGRWYPTPTTLPNGNVEVFSGLDENTTLVTIPELYKTATNDWARLFSANRVQGSLYPYMFVLPDGNLVDAGPDESRVLTTSTWTWEAQAIAPPAWPVPPPPAPLRHGSAVMYEPGKIMRCGGQDPAVDTTWVIDLTGDARQWLVAGAMK